MTKLERKLFAEVGPQEPHLPLQLPKHEASPEEYAAFLTGRAVWAANQLMRRTLYLPRLNLQRAYEEGYMVEAHDELDAITAIRLEDERRK